MYWLRRDPGILAGTEGNRFSTRIATGTEVSSRSSPAISGYSPRLTPAASGGTVPLMARRYSRDAPSRITWAATARWSALFFLGQIAIEIGTW